MQKIYKFIFVLLILASAHKAYALEPVSSDPRIRTFVYGKNDVFKIVSLFGYQTVVELGDDEKILTISMGNPNIFKITPSGNRIFMKAMQNGQITNMTVITDVRTYQIDLSSVADTPEEIMYVVRFTYLDKIGEEKAEPTGPMQLYSPISLSSKQSFSGPQMPSLSSSNSMPSSPDMNVPVSIRIKDPSERKGMHLSPIQLTAPPVF